MSAFPSSYLGDKILDLLLNATSFTPPSNIYLALYESDPTPTNTGTELSGGSYARQALDFDPSSGSEAGLDAGVLFAAVPAATVTHYGILDASTGGNLLIYGQLNVAIEANDGDDIEIGTLYLSLSGS